MSVSLHVVGYQKEDETFLKMKAAYIACKDAGLVIPNSLEDYFDCCDPRDNPGSDVNIQSAVSEFNDNYRQGYDIDIEKLPPSVKIIRAYLS